MKSKIVFKIDVLEMVFILISIFFSGIFFSSDGESKFMSTGLLVFSSGILLLKKRVRVPSEKKK
tara:strand:- start:6894 stop:7085 length:192 start_codon:yes stop_codon:yes gene_type:complete